MVGCFSLTHFILNLFGQLIETPQCEPWSLIDLKFNGCPSNTLALAFFPCLMTQDLI